MKTRYLFFLLPLVIACSSPLKQTDPKPTATSSFEELPKCSSYAWVYLKNQPPLAAVDTNFENQAIKDAKRLWTTNQQSMNDRGVANAIDAGVLAKYTPMPSEDFTAFMNCWH
jgi:hypothetical protein